ncbi:MAG TPA: response regulator, partial [Vicinamibacteria bacterium]
MKPRILIVDDEDAVRSSLKMIFEYAGYEVTLAANGPVGLKLAEQEAPDLVFLDIKMPQMDGLEVLKQLKEREGSP